MTTDPLPVTISVFDKALARVGWIGDPVSVAATRRHNAIGTCSMVLPGEHQMIPALCSDGAGILVEYPDDAHFLSGEVVKWDVDDDDFFTFEVESDESLLWQVLGWPAPASAISSQGTSYDKRTGAAETVFKDFVTANAVTRLGLPVTVTATSGRGGTVTVQCRMHILADKLIPILEANGLGFIVKQSGASFTVDVYQCGAFPLTLSKESGTVVTLKASRDRGDVTRVIIGGAGELTAREFRRVIDTAAEAAFRHPIEVFRDARDTDVDAELDQRGLDRIAEGAPKAGLSAELSETDVFRYGGLQGLQLGDSVTIEIREGLERTDIVREVALSWTKEDGLVVTPVVGERTDDPDKALVTLVSRLGADIRDLKSNR